MAAAKESPIVVGKKAPVFTGVTDTGDKVKLSEFKGESPVVLFFYPKDNTPGCTTEVCDFQADLSKFKRAGAVVYGVSPDSIASHEKFRDKFKLKFPLISDESKAICEKYGVWVEKNMYGRKYMGVQRATFLIDLDGKVAQVWPKVKVAGHVEEVLGAVKVLAKS